MSAAVHLSSYQELAAALVRARQGRGGVALLNGHTASGKTYLLDEVAQQARGAGDLVLTAVCSKFDRTDHLALLGQLSASLAQPVDPAVTGADDLADRFTAQAGASAVLVTVDDLRHADPASQRFVKQLAVCVTGRPILLVCADRVRPLGGVHGLWSDLVGRPDLRQIDIKPMTSREIIRTAWHRFGLNLGESFARRLAAHTNGSMPLVGALLADQITRYGQRVPDGAAPAYGRAYRQAVLDCLHALDPEDRDVAEAVAVIGSLGGIDMVTRVAGGVPAEEAIAELTACGLLDKTGFRSRAAHEAVLHNMSGSRRAALSRQVVELLVPAGASADDLASWLTTVENLDPIGDVVPPQPQRRVSASRFVPVSVLEMLGDGSDCHPDFAGAGSTRRHWQIASEQSGIVEPRSLWHATETVAALEEQIAGLPPDACFAVADLRTRLLSICCEYPTLLPSALARVQTDSSRLSTYSPRFAAVHSLCRVLRGHDRQTALVAAWDALAAMERARDNSRAVVSALTTLLHENQLEPAESWCERFGSIARGQGDVPAVAELLAFQAQITMRRGDMSRAIERAERALELITPEQWGIRLGMPLSTLLLCTTAIGDREAGVTYFRHRLPEAMFDSRYGLHYLYARGHFYLAAGEHLFALADYLRCGRLMTLWQIDSQELDRWRLGVAASYMAMNNYDKAVSTIAEAVPRMPDDPLGVEHTRKREFIFEALLESLTDKPALLHTIEHLCRNVFARTATEPAARYKIVDRYADCLDQLTLAERQVALLAAKGSTNRAIARELSITVSTVEQHLTRAYRKLRVTGRNELRVKLG
ncbi:LuxR C-terminal-related transcriptional regulator [Allorhizocola rhizosphaerae]|uniref:LuxR C-terminal-related transcriptional regulator n=1 Tax=Allorhizocola rhizosphaerae TaxID=1872709 RepID=UPI000E3B5FA4|nr:LuxR C-terminal-related transcriptional regulator [Allorhizocola rhizosphaerae]